MALSAAFSMARIIIGVANTGGSIASLNWLARCAGVTRSVKVPFTPSGIGRMHHHRWFAPEGSPPRPSGWPEEQSYFQSTGCMKSSAEQRKSSRDRQCCARPPCRREDVHSLQGPISKGAMRGYCGDLGGGRVGFFVAYNFVSYMLFPLVTHPRDAGNIGHALNEFEERQLVEWT